MKNIEVKKASVQETIELISRLNYRNDTFEYHFTTREDNANVKYRNFDAYRENGEKDSFAITEVVVDGTLAAVRFYNLFRDIVVEFQLTDREIDHSHFDNVINADAEIEAMKIARDERIAAMQKEVAEYIDDDPTFANFLPALDELNDVDEWQPIVETVCLTEDGNEFRRFTVNNETVTYFNGELNFIKSDTYHASLAAYRNQYVVEVPDGQWKKFKRLDVDEFHQIMSERGACTIDKSADVDAENELAEAERKKLIAELKADGYKFTVTTIKVLAENDSATILPTKTYVQTYEKALHELNLQAKFYATNPVLDGGFELATLDGAILLKGDKVADYEKVIVDKNQPLVDKKPIMKRKRRTLHLAHINQLKEARL